MISAVKGYPPVLRKMYVNDVPQRLRPTFNVKEPIYELAQPIEIVWRDWHIRIGSGLLTDGASVPWVFRFFGIARNDGTPWKDFMALPHDAIYSGLARFPGYNNSGNRLLADQCMRDCGLWAAPVQVRRRVKLFYYAVRIAGWFSFKPRPDLQDQSLVTINRIDAGHDD